MGRCIALLDAHVLYAAPMRDLLMELYQSTLHTVHAF